MKTPSFIRLAVRNIVVNTDPGTIFFMLGLPAFYFSGTWNNVPEHSAWSLGERKCCKLHQVPGTRNNRDAGTYCRKYRR